VRCSFTFITKRFPHNKYLPLSHRSCDMVRNVRF